MTLATTENTKTYTGDGLTTEFPFPYLFYANSHIVVTVDGATQALDTDYNLSGVSNPSGGTITFLSAPALNEVIVIQRVVPYTQETDFENFDGNPSDVTEKQFDLLTMQTQQIAEQNDRSILAPVGVTLTSNEISGTIDSTLRVLTITSDGPAASDLTAVSLSGSVDTLLTDETAGDIIIYNGNYFVNATTLAGDYTFSGANTYSGTSAFTGTVTLSGKVSIPDGGEKTISGGAISTTASFHTVDTQSDAASDDLDQNQTTANGLITLLRSENSSRTVVLKHNTSNLFMPCATDISLSTTHRVVGTIYDSELNRHIVLFDGTTKEYVDNAVGTDVASVYHNTTQSIGTSTETLLAFNSEDFDTGGWHDNSTNNSRITVDFTGYVRVTGQFSMSPGTAGFNQRLTVYKNGSGTNLQSDVTHGTAASSQNRIIQVSGLLAVTSGDYIELSAWHNFGSSQNALANTTRLSVERVRV